MTVRRSALRALVDEQISAGNVLAPVAHKLQPPRPRTGLVARNRLVARLQRPSAEIAVVTAPAGYGKTTLLAELVSCEPRRSAWLTLDVSDNDPDTLLTSVALVLWPTTTPALPRFGRMLAGCSTPFVLVLDDVHTVDGARGARRARHAGGQPARRMPPGAGRPAAPSLKLGRLRVKRTMVEIGREELAFGPDETITLYRELGVDLTDDRAARLVERTEGWPAALYLAALAHMEGGTEGGDDGPAGDDVGASRYVTDYVHDELLDDLDADTTSFLLGASCLERLSGPLCDAALGRRGSAGLLDDLERRNLLVIPLDRRREWYRLHRVLSDCLQVELARRGEPDPRVIHRRASEWFRAHGDADAAVGHAAKAGDTALVESLVLSSFGRYATTGRHATITRWMALFDEERLSSSASLAAFVAFSLLQGGDGAGALHWLARAEGGLPRGRKRPTGTSVAPDVVVALLRATVRETPAADMVADAGSARRKLPFGDWHSLSCLLLGAGEFMLGNDHDAEAVLEEGVAEASVHAPSIQALCLAHLAVLHVERDDWPRATTLARQGREVLADGGLEAVPNLFLVTAVSSLVEAHAGRLAEADSDRLLTRRRLVGFERVAPWANLQARIALARSSLVLGDRVAARTEVDEADRFLDRVPDAIRVKEQVVEVRRALREPVDAEGWGSSSLTTAEIRVLQYLPTHLTLVEIADRSFVSRNTIKTQAISIYRKLGASSRGSAVDLARESGLLDHDLL